MPIILTPDWSSQAVSSIAKNMPENQAKKWEIQAGHMFFKHKRATYHRACIEKCYAKMIAAMHGQFVGQNIEGGTHSSYAGPLLEVLLFHLDSYFEAERSGYDFVLPCLCTADFFRTVPSSFNDFYARRIKNPNTYPSEPPDLNFELMEFWRKTGQRTRDYRNCLTHYISLSGPTWQHAMNMKWLNESWKATFHLPDNPEAKSYSALTFDSNLDALNVCTQLNKETEDFLKKLLIACSNKWDVINANAILDTSFTIHNIQLGD